MPKRKYYAVVAGRQPGIYDEWGGAGGAEAQVNAFPNAIYKSFPSRAEAEQWYKQRIGAPIGDKARHPAPATPQSNYALAHTAALAEGKVVIYTDGGCEGNPGKGSYGVVLLYKAQRKELSGGYARTTNNRMEMMACIVGLNALKQPSRVVILSDSAYVVNSMSKGWAIRWRAQGWQRKQDDAHVKVPNADLWQQLLEICTQHEVEFVKVRGHAGITENERCHQLASAVLAREGLPPDPGFAAE